MKRLTLLSLLLLTAFNSLKAQENNIIPGKIIVMLNSSDAAEKLAKQLTTINSIQTQFKIERSLSESMNIFLCEFNPSFINPNILLNLIKINPYVKVAQFDHYFKNRSIPDDSLYSLMWNMNNTGANSGIADADIDAPEAWNMTTGGLTAQGDTIVVAVIDDGFDINHKDLSFWKNYQEIPNDSIDNDGNGYIDDFDGWNAYSKNDNFPSKDHGTHISGIIGAKGNNHIGVTGINWNMKVMPIVYGPLSESNVVAAYSYVRDQRKLYNETNGAKGAFIVATNCSFGVDLKKPSDFPLWCGMYDSLGAVGILNVGATANNNYNIDTQGDIPTSCTSNYLVTVTNTTYRDEKNSFCGYGLTTIDLGAPGTNVLSALPNNTYGKETGTSMATPHVTGAIALMYSLPCNQFITNYKANPSQVALIVKDSLLGAVDKIPALDSITVTGGRLNLFKSVYAMQNYCNAVGISENEQLSSGISIKNIFPNPATERVTVIYENTIGKGELVINNVIGQEIMKVQLENSTNQIQQKSIDVSNIKAGIYFLTIESNTPAKSNVMKLIIR